MIANQLDAITSPPASAVGRQSGAACRLAQSLQCARLRHHSDQHPRIVDDDELELVNTTRMHGKAELSHYFIW
jgi:hypothetical protein